MALALACLGGVGVAELAQRLRRPAAAGGGRGGRRAGSRCRAGRWPLATGRAIDGQVTCEAVPGRVGAAPRGDLDRGLPRNARALVLPGQLFAFYRWGGTVDPILPALTDRPVAVRHAVPYADLHAVDLLWAIDALVQQQRAAARPAAAAAAADGAGAVVTGDRRRARAQRCDARRRGRAALSPQRLGGPGPRTARARRFRGADGASSAAGAARGAPLRPAGARGIVRVEPRRAGHGRRRLGRRPGRAGGVRGAAARARRSSTRATATPAELRRAARGGAELVVERLEPAPRVRALAAAPGRRAATLAAGDPISRGRRGARPVPRPRHRRADGGRGVEARAACARRSRPGSPSSPSTGRSPRSTAIPRTAWLRRPDLDADRRWVEVELRRAARRPVDRAAARGASARTTSTAVEIAGRRYAVRPGWNRLRLGLRDVRHAAVLIAATPSADGRGSGRRSPRCAIPGVRVREPLRPPRWSRSRCGDSDLAPLGPQLRVRAHDRRRPVPARRGPAARAQPRPRRVEDPEARSTREAHRRRARAGPA